MALSKPPITMIELYGLAIACCLLTIFYRKSPLVSLIFDIQAVICLLMAETLRRPQWQISIWEYLRSDLKPDRYWVNAIRMVLSWRFKKSFSYEVTLLTLDKWFGAELNALKEDLTMKKTMKEDLMMKKDKDELVENENQKDELAVENEDKKAH